MIFDTETDAESGGDRDLHLSESDRKSIDVIEERQGYHAHEWKGTIMNTCLRLSVIEVAINKSKK